MERSQRPAHIIRHSEVAAWLAASVNKRVTTHWTSETSAQNIREAGAQIKQAAIDATWGQGFYTSDRPMRESGAVGVRVAIRLQRPFVVEDRIAAHELIEDLIAETGIEDRRRAMQAAGYDGVIVHWESGETWVVAFEDDQVKVIEER
jgi:hypothetical protein